MRDLEWQAFFVALGVNISSIGSAAQFRPVLPRLQLLCADNGCGLWARPAFLGLPCGDAHVVITQMLAGDHQHAPQAALSNSSRSLSMSLVTFHLHFCGRTSWTRVASSYLVHEYCTQVLCT